MNAEIRGILERLFKELKQEAIGGNYSIFLDSQNALEELLEKESNDLKDDEVNDLQDEVWKLEQQVEDMEDECNCDCDVCKKCKEKE